MKKFFKDFKAFIAKGNVVDMAVGVIIGAAFSAIVTSLVNDIVMPLISLAVGGVSEKNAADFIAAGCVGIGVGGNLVNKEWIAKGEFHKIQEVARQLCAAVGR